MNLYLDKRIVMTLDAGGTNFVFSAVKGGEEIIEPVILSSQAHDLNLCLKTIIKGFKIIEESLLPLFPVAISFAFPGPANYKEGIIGDLMNLPAFNGGVALGPMLEQIFNLPTFINNDGDLFTYGEAMAGILPRINKLLKENNVEKQYKNLFGVTLGTGFGGGIVVNNQILVGDNSAAGEIWLMRNFRNVKVTAEEDVSIRAIQRNYSQISKDKQDLTPKQIFNIAMGEKSGDRNAALKAFEEMALSIGESLANAITLMDAPVVIGGGISGASELILPKVVKHLNGTIENLHGQEMSRLVSRFYNLEDSQSINDFINWKNTTVKIPFTDKEITCRPEKRLAIGLSELGTSKAICLGAYAFALNSLDKAIKSQKTSTSEIA